MGQRVSVACELKPVGVGAGKPSLNRATKYAALDPKADDLAMGRLKLG